MHLLFFIIVNVLMSYYRCVHSCEVMNKCVKQTTGVVQTDNLQFDHHDHTFLFTFNLNPRFMHVHKKLIRSMS